MPLSKQEINRKLFHFVGLFLPIGIFYFPMIFGISDIIVIVILAILLITSVFIEKLRFRHPDINKIFQTCFRSMLRNEERENLTGSTWLIGSALICSILFRKLPHISFIALTLFMIGDAAAALVGQGIGKIKIGKKTLEGSIACFLVCTVIFSGIFPFLPFLLDRWGGSVPLPLILVTSLAITVFELIPVRVTGNLTINDNLAVPVIAGFVMKYFYPVF